MKGDEGAVVEGKRVGKGSGEREDEVDGSGGEARTTKDVL